MLRSTPLLAIALLVAGCTASASSDPARNVADFAPTGQVEALRLPFDAYAFSLSEMYAISNAEDLLTQQCMRAKGHDWQVIKRPTDLKDLRNRRRYGVIEIRIAQQFGYHVPEGLLTPAEVEQQYDRRDSGMSETQREAALGEGGCGHEAVKQLRPAEAADPERLQQLGRESLVNSQDEPRVTAAMDSWRNCMRETGFTYQDPFAAMSDSKWWADDSAGPSRDEISVAVADVRCKERTSLIDVWHATEVKIQEELITRYPDYFQQLGASMRHELTAAHAVLARM